jgi:hypothetical protein
MNNDRLMTPPSRTAQLRSRVPAQPGVVTLHYPPLPRRTPLWRPPPVNDGRFNHPRAPCFHYVSGEALEAILSAGVIQPTVWPASALMAEMALTWCSTARIWEPNTPVAGELEIQDRYDLCHLELGQMARIAVLPGAVVSWENYLSAGGLTEAQIFYLAQRGLEWGAKPGNWYVTPAPVPSSQWRGVQEWNGEAWLNRKPEPVVVAT